MREPGVGSRWRAALIGCGEVGREHCTSLAQIDDIAFVAFCDVDAERAEAFLAEFGGQYATSSVDRILGDDGIDVVYVCTRHDSHAELCVRAARAGKHVFVEKPLALTVEECVAVGRAVEQTGITLMTGFKLRHYDMVRKLRELIPDPLVVTMQMMYDRQPDDRWVNDPVQGGGGVLSAGVHSCDIMRHVVGSEPVSVAAGGGNYYQRSGVVDNMVAVYRFENGAVGNLVQGDCSTPSFVSNFYLQAFAENRSATLSDRLCRLVYHEVGSDPVAYEGTETGFLHEAHAFVEALTTGQPVPTGYRDGLVATSMILQGFKSIRTSRTQPVMTPAGAI